MRIEEDIEKLQISERLRLVLEQLESVCVFDKNSGGNSQKDDSERINSS